MENLSKLQNKESLPVELQFKADLGNSLKISEDVIVRKIFENDQKLGWSICIKKNNNSRGFTQKSSTCLR